jgi:hypothetical protein
VKPSAEIIILSKEEGTMLKPKKARVSGVMLKAGQVLVEIGKLTDRSAEILEAIWQQNSLLGKLLGYQQHTVIATQLHAEWAWPMTKYLGWIARALEVWNEELGLGLGSGVGSGLGGGSGLGLGEKKEKGKGKARVFWNPSRLCGVIANTSIYQNMLYTRLKEY